MNERNSLVILNITSGMTRSYGLIRSCVAEHEMNAIIKSCHDSPYGGHHAGSRTAAKVLQSGFYCPTLFRDSHEYVKRCDACQRMSNISKRQEMEMKYSLVIEPFDVWGLDFLGPFTLSNGNTHILVADRKSTRLNSSHITRSRMPSSA